jgi:hypothetical protein
MNDTCMPSEPIYLTMKSQTLLSRSHSLFFIANAHTHIHASSSDDNPEVAVAMRHTVLQNVIVNSVYLGGSPSLVEEAGFGAGPQAYAKAQCAMSDFEGDPLISEYATSSLTKLWEAAGLDIGAVPQV